MTPGFDILPQIGWGAADSEILIKKFKGKASQWRAKNLAEVRDRLRKEVLAQQNNRCAYCRRFIGSGIGEHEIDHIVPTSSYGQFTYTRMNLVGSCKRCNWLKREHLPTSAVTIVPPNIYPTAEADWNWVHPYIHRYSDHIEIIDGVIFAAVAGNAARRSRGLAVINICRLDKIDEVERRKMSELAVSAVDLATSILLLIGTYPMTPSLTLAEQLKASRKLKSSLGDISLAIDEARARTGPKMAALLAGEVS